MFRENKKGKSSFDLIVINEATVFIFFTNIKECKNAKVEVFQFIDNNPAYLNKQKFGIPIVELGGGG